MGISTSAYVIYGVRVDDDADWVALDNEPGQCINDGMPGVFWAGQYDNNMTFIAVNWEELEPGRYKLIDPEDYEDPRYAHWNKVLLNTVDRLGLLVQDGPGWFFLPDQS